MDKRSGGSKFVAQVSQVDEIKDIKAQLASLTDTIASANVVTLEENTQEKFAALRTTLEKWQQTE